MTEDESRKQFEAWISGPPYEYDVERHADNHAMWPNGYLSATVDFAWITWQEARKSVEAAQ
jgi:hypothetical protein